MRAIGPTMRETTVRTVPGFLFTCDLADWIGQYVFVTATYEEPTAATMARLVAPGDVVVDVGANVGFHTLLLSRLVGPTGRVLAFEPMPHALQRLKANLAMNACDNVIIRECAIGAVPATATLYLGPRHHTSIASLQPRDGAVTVQVDCLTLDDATPDGRITLIKIDAEGWEPEVIAGASRTLAGSAAPYVIAEVSDPGWPTTLTGLGFQMFSIETHGVRPVKPRTGMTGQFNALFSPRPLPPAALITT